MRLTRDTIGLVVVAVVGLAFLFILPAVAELYTVINATVFVSFAILALSLGLIWGYGGILCFGQAAFFGIGGYTYAIAALNFGDTTGAVILAILIPAAFAALLGYFLFYGRVSDIYLAVITLTVTLILSSLFGHTAGPQYRIGVARLGGFNGIPSTPHLNVPGDASRILTPDETFYVAVAMLLILYFGCVWLLRSHFGRVVVSIRENELRAELLGYDVRLYKLIVFAIGGGIAGVAGILFANSAFNVTPVLFGLASTAQIIIWVVVGGLGTLIGPVIGAVLLQYLTTELGAQASINPSLVLGAILIVFVLFVPQGIVPSIGALWRRARPARPRSRARGRYRRPTAEASDGG